MTDSSIDWWHGMALSKTVLCTLHQRTNAKKKPATNGGRAALPIACGFSCWTQPFALAAIVNSKSVNADKGMLSLRWKTDIGFSRAIWTLINFKDFRLSCHSSFLPGISITHPWCSRTLTFSSCLGDKCCLLTKQSCPWTAFSSKKNCTNWKSSSSSLSPRNWARNAPSTAKAIVNSDWKGDAVGNGWSVVSGGGVVGR